MKKTVLITGASSGIGKELARLFAQDKYNLVLAGRNMEPLDKVAKHLTKSYGVNVQPIAIDLTEPNAIDHIYSEVKNNGHVIDVLVNNAGFGASGKFTEIDIKTQLDQITVNISALTDLSYRFVPEMVARGQGGVMNIASVAAFSPGPFMAVYYATKAYVLSLSTALANELIDTGVSVTCVCPGPTKTGFGLRAQVSRNGIFNSPMVMDVKPVAKLAYAGFQAKEQLVIIGVHNKILALASRITPLYLSAHVTRKFNH